MKQELRKPRKIKSFKSGMIIQHRLFPHLVYILLKHRRDNVWDNIQDGTFYEAGEFTIEEYQLYEGEVVLTNDFKE